MQNLDLLHSNKLKFVLNSLPQQQFNTDEHLKCLRLG
jgi:hypothetical protein